MTFRIKFPDGEIREIEPSEINHSATGQLRMTFKIPGYTVLPVLGSNGYDFIAVKD
jgi:hypothetical protein